MIKMMKIISISYEKKKNEQMTYLNFYPTNDVKVEKRMKLENISYEIS